LKDAFGEGLDERIKEDVIGRSEKLKEQGAEIVEIQLPSFKYSLAVYYLMITSEISSNLARFDGIKYGFSEANLENTKSQDILDVYKLSREIGLGVEVKRRIILGTYALSAGYYDAYYKKAQLARELIKQELSEAFKKVDAILMPTSPVLPFKFGEKTDNPLEMYLADIFTITANVAMVPALVVPTIEIEEDGKKLKSGVQLLGRWWDEQGILNIGKQIEINNEE